LTDDVRQLSSRRQTSLFHGRSSSTPPLLRNSVAVPLQRDSILADKIGAVAARP
jgi:hypothetical protein